MKYTTINIQGNLLSEDILQKIETGEAFGQQAPDFGMEPGTPLRGEIEYAWSRIKLDWKHFSEKAEKLPPNDPYGTTLARRWMEQFFLTLGFNHTRRKSSLQGDNQQSYAISHTADNLDELPLHMVGFYDTERPDKNTLDIRSSGGSSRLSPHATVQEYLNVTEHLFGIVTNGRQLRLLRDSGRLIKLTFIEFDLETMLREDKYSEFTLLFRLLHASRFPKNKTESDQCLLEKYYQESIATGNRIRDGLSQAVKESLVALGNGFLQHESNSDLREKLLNGKLNAKDYYRQLMRIIYRFLFLMVTEERDLIYDPDDKSENTKRLKKIYLQYYSIARLRKLSENRYLYETQFNDLWQGLVQSFQLFEAGGNGKKLGILPLDGDLFNERAIEDLQDCQLSNQLLLECVRNMNEFTDDKKNLVHINYRSLDVEELGSVYEGLLELYPVIENLEANHPAHIHFSFHEGTDRKTTGSYYTRPELVNELIKSALIPVIEERLKDAAKYSSFSSGEGRGEVREAQAKALLQLKVCDAAAGSGHMLLAAARTIAWYLARVQSGEENPAPSVYRQCLREVIQHCIYAVDFNPDAVELCKLALWLEGHNSGKPLSFLDHKIRNGNSLVGVTDLSVLQKGIPTEAYNPVTGDDKAVCQSLKKDNQAYLRFREGRKDIGLQTSLDFEPATDLQPISNAYKQMESLKQDDVEGVKMAKKQFEKLRNNPNWFDEWRACNLWTAAFFWQYQNEELKAVPTSQKLADFLKNPAAAFGPMTGKADALSMEHKFFHWPLEFPDVWEKGGFDVMLGNPPWERIKLQQQEFFATRDAKIANAANAAARNRLIQALQQTNPELHQAYTNAMHTADATGKFLRESGRCQLTAVGDINTYSIFSELTASLVNEHGRTGIIVPTGIATDDSNKAFFGAMVESNRLVSLFDFENKEAIFQDVHRSYKFCLLTLAGKDIGQQKARFGFFLTRVEHLQDDRRIFSLSKEDFLRLNPNTKTCPVFRTRKDAELTTKIYQRVPVLINEATGENPWGVRFMRMFDMSNDSHLFRTRQQLEAEGFELWGNQMKRGDEKWLPLYEGKMCWIYDHRFSTYVEQDYQKILEKNSLIISFPQYFVHEQEVQKRLMHVSYKNKWNFGIRRVTNNTNERMLVGSYVPYSAITYGLYLFISNLNAEKIAFLSSAFNSIVIDYFARNSTSQPSLTYSVINQFPIISPTLYRGNIVKKIVFITLELIYTSWDIKAFADDVWKEADVDLRAAIQQQWEANKAATGGHEWAPPEWCEIDPEGCPLPPFKWDEERRAVLKAELDAIYAKLYGLTTEELRYILDPQDVYGPDFPGETFRVLKEKEIRLYGEYRTKRLVLEAWERMQRGAEV